MQQYRLGTLNLTPKFQGTERVEAQIAHQWPSFSQSYLCNEASLKPQRKRFREFLGSGMLRNFWKVAHLERAWKHQTPSPIPHPIHYFI